MIDSLLWAVGSACTSGLFILVSGYRILKTQKLNQFGSRFDPHRLPRGTSSLLVVAVYHPPSSVAEQNSMLIAHLQNNIENFLASYPEGMVIITGDFNPTSTRIKSSDVTMATGLRQIVTVPTRNNSILDWCFTNKPKLLSKPVQLP